MFALLIPGNFPVRDKNRFFKVCEGNGTDAVKFACVTEDVALAALLHGGLFDYCFIDIRRCAAASSGDTVSAEKAFGEVVFLNRADCLVSHNGFGGAFQLAADQNDLITRVMPAAVRGQRRLSRKRRRLPG